MHSLQVMLCYMLCPIPHNAWRCRTENCNFANKNVLQNVKHLDLCMATLQCIGTILMLAVVVVLASSRSSSSSSSNSAAPEAVFAAQSNVTLWLLLSHPTISLLWTIFAFGINRHEHCHGAIWYGYVDWVGIGSLGGMRYRAPYGANDTK